MKTTLVVMAAGMGSRFGGLKQATPITPDGRCLLDFSVYDAKEAGFDDVIFIIRQEIEEDFKRLVGDRIAKRIPTQYVLQDMSLLPAGRKKPFGTAQAILCCQNLVHNPFAVINADDYYGKNAYVLLHQHLVQAKPGEYCMVAYEFQKTSSQNGAVNRGVCSIENGYLKQITETIDIQADGTYEVDGIKHQLDQKTPVSMNIWGLTPDVFPFIAEKYEEFLRHANLSKDEFYIPKVMEQALEEKKATIRVYPDLDQWYGMTYQADLEEVRLALTSYVKEGRYPGI